MREVAVVVEGPTEEQFVQRILQPRALTVDVYLQPVIVKTKQPARGPAHRGGGGWPTYEREIRRLLGATNYAAVTILIDFYGYPSNAPGADCCSRPHHPWQCVAIREAALGRVIGTERFVPNVVLHEFETFVIAAAVHKGDLLGDAWVADELRAVVQQYGGEVELVNDGPRTAPSKRIEAIVPGYVKTSDGITAIEDVGLDAVVQACPRLGTWFDRVVVG